MNLEEFKSLNITNSKDLYQLSDKEISELCVELSVTKDWTVEQKNENMLSVTCDKPDWVFACENGTVAYSSNEEDDYIYKSQSNSRGLVLTLKKGRLGDKGKTKITKMLKTKAVNKSSNYLYKNIFNMKEDINMSEMSQSSQEDLMAKLQQRRKEFVEETGDKTTEAPKRDLPQSTGFTGVSKASGAIQSNRDMIATVIEDQKITAVLTSNGILGRTRVQVKDIQGHGTNYSKKLSQAGIDFLGGASVTTKAKDGIETTYQGNDLIEAVKAGKVKTSAITGFDNKTHVEKTGVLIVAEVKPGAKFFVLEADKTIIEGISTNGIASTKKMAAFLAAKRVPAMSGTRASLIIKEDIAKEYAIMLANDFTGGKVMEYSDGSYLRVEKKLKSSGKTNRFEDLRAKMIEAAPAFIAAVTPEGKTAKDLKTTAVAKAYREITAKGLESGISKEDLIEIIRLYDESCQTQLIRVVDGVDSKVIFPRDLFMPVKYNNGMSIEEVAALKGSEKSIDIQSGFFKPLSAKKSKEDETPKFELLNSAAKADLENSVYEGSYVSKSLMSGALNDFLKVAIIKDLEGNHYGQENDFGIAIKAEKYDRPIMMPLVVADSSNGETKFVKEKTYKTAVNTSTLVNETLEEKQREQNSPLVDAMYAKVRENCPALDNELMRLLTKVEKGGTNTVDQGASIAAENSLKSMLGMVSVR